MTNYSRSIFKGNYILFAKENKNADELIKTMFLFDFLYYFISLEVIYGKFIVWY